MHSKEIFVGDIITSYLQQNRLLVFKVNLVTVNGFLGLYRSLFFAQILGYNFVEDNLAQIFPYQKIVC